MRVLNRRQLDRIPMVDAGNLYLGEIPETVEQKRSRIQKQQMQEAQKRQLMAMQASNQRRQAEYARDQMSGAYEEMLKRSLRNTGRKSVVAVKHQGKQYGVNNALLGFVDETTEPNYSQSEVYRAPEFKNGLTAKDCKNYTRFKDWPLVIDSPRGDFGGILTSEAGSPDFSTWITDDVKQDFGYVPRPRRRR